MRKAIRGLPDRAAFALILVICFGYHTIRSLISLISGTHRFELSTSRAIRGIVTELLMLLLAGWILKIRGWNFRRLGPRFSLPGLLYGIPLFIVYMMVYYAAVIIVSVFIPPATYIQSMRMIPTAPAGLLLAFIIINSFFEEITVAGYVISALSQERAVLAITASTLLRFLYHLYQGPIATLSILPLGILFGMVYWRWRNLWPLIVAHTIVNIMSLMVMSNRGT